MDCPTSPGDSGYCSPVYSSELPCSPMALERTLSNIMEMPEEDEQNPATDEGRPLQNLDQHTGYVPFAPPRQSTPKNQHSFKVKALRFGCLSEEVRARLMADINSPVADLADRPEMKDFSEIEGENESIAEKPDIFKYPEPAFSENVEETSSFSSSPCTVSLSTGMCNEGATISADDGKEGISAISNNDVSTETSTNLKRLETVLIHSSYDSNPINSDDSTLYATCDSQFVETKSIQEVEEILTVQEEYEVAEPANENANEDDLANKSNVKSPVFSDDDFHEEEELQETIATEEKSDQFIERYSSVAELVHDCDVCDSFEVESVQVDDRSKELHKTEPDAVHVQVIAEVVDAIVVEGVIDEMTSEELVPIECSEEGIPSLNEDDVNVSENTKKYGHDMFIVPEWTDNATADVDMSSAPCNKTSDPENDDGVIEVDEIEKEDILELIERSVDEVERKYEESLQKELDEENHLVSVSKDEISTSKDHCTESQIDQCNAIKEIPVLSTVKPDKSSKKKKKTKKGEKK